MHYFDQSYLDFEVDDGLRKLHDLGLSVEAGKNAEGETIYKVPPIEEGCRRLDEIWDNLFQYNNDAEAAGASLAQSAG